MLESKTAVIYGGGGAIGGAVARAFARAGAHVHIVGRTRDRVEAVANDIGDAADVAQLDVLDERAVAEHADAVAAAGAIDIAVNAVSFPYVSGTPFADLEVKEIMHPIDSFLRANLIVTKAVARHMTARRAGTILTLSTAGSRFARPGNLGFGTACAAIEQLSQRLAVELGPSGVRVVCLRPHAVPEAASNGSYTGRSSPRWRRPRALASNRCWRSGARTRRCWDGSRRWPRSPTRRPSWRQTARGRSPER